MNVKEFCHALDSHPDAKMHWMLPDKSFVPAHYHITEVGKVQKDFIDCGGTVSRRVPALNDTFMVMSISPPEIRRGRVDWAARPNA